MTEADIWEYHLGPQDDVPHLAPYPELRVLDATCTAFSDSNMAQLRYVPQLSELYLGGTRVTDAGLCHLRHLGAIKRVGLGNLRISDQLFSHISMLDQLIELSVENTSLRNLCSSQPIRIPWLDLSGNRLSDLAFSSLCHPSSRIELLGLASMTITDHQAGCVGAMPHLRELDIDKTSITLQGMTRLVRAPNLRKLICRFVDIPQRFIESLRSSRPELTIIQSLDNGTHAYLAKYNDPSDNSNDSNTMNLDFEWRWRNIVDEKIRKGIDRSDETSQE